MIQRQLDQQLNTACLEGHLEKVRFLLTSPEVKRQYGIYADIETQSLIQDMEPDMNPLINACMAGHMEVIRYLLTSPEIIQLGSKHANIEVCGGKPLSFASYNGHLNVVRYLMSSPELPAAGGKNAQLCDRENALYYACLGEHVEIVKYLLSSPEITAAGGRHATLEPGTTLGSKNNLNSICQHNNLKVLNYLIFEYRLQRTPQVQAVLTNYPEINQLFNVRDSHQALQDKLSMNIEQNIKRVKL